MSRDRVPSVALLASAGSRPRGSGFRYTQQARLPHTRTHRPEPKHTPSGITLTDRPAAQGQSGAE